MNFGDMRMLVNFYLRRDDIPVSALQSVFRAMFKELQRLGFFTEARTSVRLSVSNPYAVPVPDDYRDDENVVVSRIEGLGAIPLIPVRSLDHFTLLYGSREFPAIKSSFSPSIPSHYTIAKPTDFFSNMDDDIPEDIRDVKCVLFFPPIDYTQYDVTLQYYKEFVIDELNDDYTNDLMKTYPEWILYEVIWRMALVLRDTEAVTQFQALAQKKYLEALQHEASRFLSPHTTIKLSGEYVSRRPLPGPRTPGPEERQVIL